MTLLQALSLSHEVQARPIVPGDHVFLRELYISVRDQEVAAAGWSPAERRAFLTQQFEFQQHYYEEHYPDAEYLLLLHADGSIGRLYGHRGTARLTLMDISLVPAWRGHGLGTALMRLLTDYADAHGHDIGLHVEPTNPAYRLYLRFGFQVTGGNGVYLQMRRSAMQAATASTEGALA